MSPRVFNLIKDDRTVWEEGPLEKLAKKNQLSSFRHNGFWQPMDTLRDKIKLINNAFETEKIAKSKKNNDGVYIVPAFSGIGAPYWRPDARGVITGLTRDSDWKSLVTVSYTHLRAHET